MARPYIIIVQGSPATGKTTLSRRLSKDLSIGVLAKDDLKELLYDKIGIPIDRGESRVYGTAVMRAMFVVIDEFISVGKSIIIESAFHKELAEQDLFNLQSKYNVVYIQLFCKADTHTQLKRYNDRILDGTRHKGHPDSVRKTDANFEQYNQQYQRLAIPDTIDINTASFSENDYAGVLTHIRELIIERTT